MNVRPLGAPKNMEALKEISSVCCMVALFANLLHWRGRRAERYVYFPTLPGLTMLLTICGIAAGVSMLFWLIRISPFQIAGFFGQLYFTIVWMYSIWFRSRQRQVKI
jgi:hypothetical protein